MIIPDVVLYNGIVRTLAPGQPAYQAVAVWRDRIAALGDNSLAESVPPARRIDLAGRLVLPGFCDCHVHLMEYALRRRQVNLSGTRSVDEALERVRGAARHTPPGEWILGGGWDPNIWEPASFPTRWMLDAVCRDHPVALDSKDLHSLWVNSLALEHAGINVGTPDPSDGRIVRDESGEPTGILCEMPAKELIWSAVPPPSFEQRCALLEEAMPSFWEHGITSIHNFLLSDGVQELGALQELRRQGKLGLRVLCQMSLDMLEPAVHAGVRTGLGDEWLRIGGVKIFMDGSLGSRTALLFEPYVGEPANKGVEITSPAQLREYLELALPHGISATIHAIGDAANRRVLDALEEIFTRFPDVRALPNRVEHVQLLAPADIPRFGRLGVTASVQPVHATSDYEMVERYWGRERGGGAYAFRSLLEAGARLIFGTDCPVEPLGPLATLYAAVARRRPDGSPSPEGWNPAERLTQEQAVHALCTAPAAVSGEQALKGTLEPGKLADMVILSQDIFSGPPEVLLETRVEGTVLGGRLVYGAL
ncbi:MAG: amidohydrolase [Anaerolineae bacterium]